MDALGLEFYTNREKYDAIIKKAALHILEESWSIPLPGSYSYKFWPSWVKDYRGEGNVGYLNAYIWLNYIWVDQDLKEEMTGKR
jgi:hypothetical protein